MENYNLAFKCLVTNNHENHFVIVVLATLKVKQRINVNSLVSVFTSFTLVVQNELLQFPTCDTP